ncbi:methyltransferase [Glycomyces tenuis]|uniref:methyltransferase n=1 Tax=Glycomyces tenuis TaxID=58116 RepID=UPI000692328B|nr:class I SAM-dependent methyltransferase [Glycomyces tenuis]
MCIRDSRGLLAAADDDPIGVWTRLFTVGTVVEERAAAAALAPLGLDEALDCGLLVRSPGGVAAGWGLQFADERAVFSDQRPNTTGARSRDHVLGIGGASELLLDAALKSEARTALDLGTGCGVQALALAGRAEAVTATDLSDRALAFAALNAEVNGVDLELLRGDMLEPVAGRRFDLVVANPPFVVATPGDGWRYRDGGREADGVAAELAAASTGLLNPGGTMQFLANWLHVRGTAWGERVAAWLPESGALAWVVEREVLDPLDYVRTWQRDSGETGDAEQAAAWLDWFDEHEVEGIGFGMVGIRRIDGASEVVCEEARHAVETPWSDRVADWFAVRGVDLEPETLWASRLRLADGVALQQAAELGDEGWEVERQWLRQRHGMRYAEQIDPLLVAFLGACDGEAEVCLQMRLLAETYGAETAMLYAQLYPLIRRLVERGFLALQ